MMNDLIDRDNSLSGDQLDLSLFSVNSILRLWKTHPQYRKLVGIDWGERRIGIAISDLSGAIASPLTTVLQPSKPIFRPGLKTRQRPPHQRSEETLQGVVDIICHENPLAICLGLPLNMNGSMGFQAQKVLLFRQKLAQKLDIPIVLCDERLSSMAVERVMISEDRTRRFRQRHVDQNAAAFVLQGAIDRLNHALTREEE